MTKSALACSCRPRITRVDRDYYYFDWQRQTHSHTHTHISHARTWTGMAWLRKRADTLSSLLKLQICLARSVHTDVFAELLLILSQTNIGAAVCGCAVWNPHIGESAADTSAAVINNMLREFVNKMNTCMRKNTQIRYYIQHIRSRRSNPMFATMWFPVLEAAECNES